jgi:hypothetical protein
VLVFVFEPFPIHKIGERTLPNLQLRRLTGIMAPSNTDMAQFFDFGKAAMPDVAQEGIGNDPIVVSNE